MGLLDILGSAATIGANTQGQYLQGQAAGQQQAQQNLMAMLNAKRQKSLDEQNAAQNQFDATMKLRQQGYMPVEQVQGEIANTQRAQFGQGAPIAPGDISGLAAMAINALKAQEQAAGLRQRVTNPFSKQEYAFNYDASPQGLIEKRTKALAAEKVKTDAAQLDQKNKNLYGAMKAEFGSHPLAKRPYDPNTDYSSVIIDQRDLRKINAGQSKEHWSVVPNYLGPDGKPVQQNSLTGEVRSLPGSIQSGGSGGGGAMAQSNDLRKMVAVFEAPFILKRMKEFEKNHTVHGVFNLPLGEPTAAQVQAGPASSHPFAAAGQEIAGRFADPKTNEYYADAARMARLQQLLSARGGSEAMVGQEQRLFRAQTGDAVQQVLSAQQARETMLGEFGAVMAQLTDEQKRKLAAGLAAIKAKSETVALPDGGVKTYGDLSKDIFATPTATTVQPKKPVESASPLLTPFTGSSNTNTVQPKTIEKAAFDKMTPEDKAIWIKRGYRVKS